MILNEKYEKLKNVIKSLDKAAVAFSGGVDSTLLIKICRDILGDNAIAVTVIGYMQPQREITEAKKYANFIGIKQNTVILEKNVINDFSHNPPDRCYFCKHKIFSKIIEIADKHGIKHVIDGSNVDDMNDYRPGMRAIKELGVISPLKEAGFSKSEIRELSKQLELPTWDKPALACLISRLPYGEPITENKLKMIEQAEEYLSEKEFKQFRVRYHKDIARIEVAPEEREKFFDIKLMDELSNEFKRIGFTYVTMDLSGYKTGSMNVSLTQPPNED